MRTEFIRPTSTFFLCVWSVGGRPADEHAHRHDGMKAVRRIAEEGVEGKRQGEHQKRCHLLARSRSAFSTARRTARPISAPAGAIGPAYSHPAPRSVVAITIASVLVPLAGPPCGARIPPSTSASVLASVA